PLCPNFRDQLSETIKYGGNTASVEVRGRDGTIIVLDAGTGIRRLGTHLTTMTRVDILLSHLHMDHTLGLGFFGPLFNPLTQVHVWGPAGSVQESVAWRSGPASIKHRGFSLALTAIRNLSPI